MDLAEDDSLPYDDQSKSLAEQSVMYNETSVVFSTSTHPLFCPCCSAHTMSPLKEISDTKSSPAIINPMRRKKRRRGISLLKTRKRQGPAGRLVERSKVHCVDEPESDEKKSDLSQDNLVSSSFLITTITISIRIIDAYNNAVSLLKCT